MEYLDRDQLEGDRGTLVRALHNLGLTEARAREVIEDLLSTTPRTEFSPAAERNRFALS